MSANRRAVRQKSNIAAAAQTALGLTSKTAALLSHQSKSESAAQAAVLAHNCLLTKQGLRRNSKGQLSATATYTALRKAAAGGSLIPEACQPDKTDAQQGHDQVAGRHTKCAPAEYQHHPELPLLWEEAQAALLECALLESSQVPASSQQPKSSQEPECSPVQADNAQQPLQLSLDAEPSCSSSKSRALGSAAASSSAVADADEVSNENQMHAC